MNLEPMDFLVVRKLQVDAMELRIKELKYAKTDLQALAAMSAYAQTVDSMLNWLIEKSLEKPENNLTGT